MRNRNPRNYTMMTDAYEFSMADAYLQNHKENEIGVFDLFFRVVPNGGGYAIMAGLDKVIDYINHLKFNSDDIKYFESAGYSKEFIEYLKTFKFTGDIYAIPDGTPVFPNEPLLTVKAPLIEAQIVETALLALINGSMEHATGARRIIESVPNGVAVMEFGARRADGCEAALDASIYGVMAGCKGTSNVMAANFLGMKALGTMAHSYVESFDTELEAFKTFCMAYPQNATLLVDTYDTLKSGVPNAIKAFEYMKEQGIETNNIGIRIDSGDLAYLSIESRKMLDAAGFENAKICLSNGLTAESIESLIHQGAKFNTLGVGDNISKPAGRMGGVYKEVALIRNGVIEPKMKLSNDIIKIVNPGFKRLYRSYDNKTGYALGDIMCEYDKPITNEPRLVVSTTNSCDMKEIENYTLVELQRQIFKNGNLVYKEPSFEEKNEYCNTEMSKLYPEVRRTLEPNIYHVSGTEEYVKLKEKMIHDIKREIRSLNKK